MGINYYSRDIVTFSWNPLRMFGELTVKENTAINDMGWEIYPKGSYRVCRNGINIIYPFILQKMESVMEKMKNVLIIFTHLFQVNRLIQEGVPVKRYYYWSLLDNLEWEFGLTPRFGII